MSLIEQIKTKNVEARKAKLTVVSTLLTTVIGEAEMIGKNAGNRAPTDAEVVKVVKKFRDNNLETIKVLGGADPRSLALMGENGTLEMFLPKQMDEAQLTATVRAIVIGLKTAQSKVDMGAVMKVLKERFDGQYDGKIASSVVKSVIASEA